MANIFDDLLNEEKTTTPATEQMRQKFNAIIAQHQLSGLEVLHMLARISAGYINHLQRAYTKQGIEVVIEEELQKRLTVYLTAFDMNNVVEEMGKLANKEKNLIEQLKTYLIMEWIIFIGVIILLGAILQVNLNSKQIKEDGEKNETALKSITGFIESKRIVGVNNKYLFAVDENNKKIALIRSVRKVVIPFDQIISVEVFEDNTMLQQKSSLRTIGGAVIGGAIAGGAGAIVGGLSGGAQQNKKVSKVQVKIKLRDINTPSYTIDCFNCKTMTVGGKPIKPSSSEGHLYKKGLNHAHRIADTISAIIDITDKADKSPEQIKFQVQKTTVSIADELTKLADLREKGILTEEEFILQKKALLGKAETSDVNTLEHIQGATLIDELPQDVKDALDSGKKLEAVKLYMDFKGCSLSEAVEDIESLN